MSAALSPAERQRLYRAAHKAEVNERAKLRQRRLRLERQAKARLKRPRCLICDDPIPYGKIGVRYDSTTCGKRGCQVRRFRWFVRAA